MVLIPRRRDPRTTYSARPEGLAWAKARVVEALRRPAPSSRLIAPVLEPQESLRSLEAAELLLLHHREEWEEVACRPKRKVQLPPEMTRQSTRRKPVTVVREPSWKGRPKYWRLDEGRRVNRARRARRVSWRGKRSAVDPTSKWKSAKEVVVVLSPILLELKVAVDLLMESELAKGEGDRRRALPALLRLMYVNVKDCRLEEQQC